MLICPWGGYRNFYRQLEGEEAAKPTVSIHLHSSAESMIIEYRKASKTDKENTGA